jgi:hypothetical protein
MNTTLWVASGILVGVRLCILLDKQGPIPPEALLTWIDVIFWAVGGILMLDMASRHREMSSKYQEMHDKNVTLKDYFNKQAGELQKLKVAIRDFMRAEGSVEPPAKGRRYWDDEKYTTVRLFSSLDTSGRHAVVDEIAGLL